VYLDSANPCSYSDRVYATPGQPVVVFIEIAGGTRGGFFVPLASVARIESRLVGPGKSTICLLDGKRYLVNESADAARVAMTTSSPSQPNRLTLDVEADEREPEFLGKA
jgi:hypothetical protein